MPRGGLSSITEAGNRVSNDVEEGVDDGVDDVVVVVVVGAVGEMAVGED